MGSLVQIVGALLVLGAFALAQAGLLTQKAASYLVLNTAGAGVLAVQAYLGAQWGFLLLEGSWALIAAFGLARLAARR